MEIVRLRFKTSALFLACLLIIVSVVQAGRAQSRVEAELKPDVRRALSTRTRESSMQKRKEGYTPMRSRATLPQRSALAKVGDEANPEVKRRRGPARVINRKSDVSDAKLDAVAYSRILAGTPLSWILHTSQLSVTSLTGTNEQYVDATGDLVADERTTFDTNGGSFDIAVGRSGSRYEVYSATLNNRRVGALLLR